MRKLLLAGLVAVVGLSLGAANAEPLPVPNSCSWAGVASTDGTVVEHCEFEAADVPAHGYLGLTPNDFVIYADANGNDVADGDEILAEVSPTEMDVIGGQLDLTAGETYDVDIFHGCAEDPACGWVGALFVG